MRTDHTQISYTKVGATKGNPRLWLESLRLSACGFDVGASYTVTLDLDARRVILRLDAQGDRVVSMRRRTLASGEERQTPIIDIANASLRDAFTEGQRIRAVLAAGEITFDLHPMEVAREQREQRLKDELKAGVISEGTVCTGAGVSTWALKEGLEAAGVVTRVDWVIDREGRYLQVAVNNNPAITDATRLYEASLEEVEVDALSQVSVLQASLPCTGHSLSGRSKLKLGSAEQHPTDALAVYGLLRILEAVNPSIIVSENVTQAMDSASYAIIRAYLHAQGYRITERVLTGADAGTIEDRSRWWFVAISEGLNASDLDMAALVPQERQYATLGDAMEDVASDSPMWRAYEYLNVKADRDKAAGKGFARQFVNEDSTRVGTVGKGVAKARSTEPFITRADGLQRLLTTVEHARIKGIPEQLVANTGFTLAHEVLGQSILWGHATAIGNLIGRHLCNLFSAPRSTRAVHQPDPRTIEIADPKPFSASMQLALL